VKVSPPLNLVGNWKEFLGGEKFVAKIEKALGRMLHRQKPGHKQRTNN